MRSETELPDGLVHDRTTPVFTAETVPAGLLAKHRIAEGVWGRIVVHRGRLTFQFADESSDPIALDVGDDLVIPPMRPHWVSVEDGVEFAIEFYKSVNS